MQKNYGAQDVVFGIHSITEILKAKKRHLQALYTTQPFPKQWPEIERLLPKAVKVHYVPRESLARMAGTTDHQSVVGFASPLPRRKKFFTPEKERLIVMLDGIQDTRNLGAILRSAYCTGVQGIIITQKKSAPLTGAAHKASAGLAEHLEIYESPSAQAAIVELKKAGYSIFLAALGGTDALSVNFTLPACIVIGNEATGISSNILHEGMRVMLPQRAPDISYNASVAAGILFFLVASKNKLIT